MNHFNHGIIPDEKRDRDMKKKNTKYKNGRDKRNTPAVRR